VEEVFAATQFAPPVHREQLASPKQTEMHRNFHSWYQSRIRHEEVLHQDDQWDRQGDPID
jgi:hypothetical protein